MAKTYSIVGMQHRPNADSILRALDPGEAVTLVREPNNEHDANAIAVWVGGSHVGYIPSKQNKVLAPFIDQTGQDLGTLALDAAKTTPGAKFIHAKFVRSPNSNYPMVEV